MLAGITRELGIPLLDLYVHLDRNSFVTDLIHLTDPGKEGAAARIAEFMGAAQILSAEPQSALDAEWGQPFEAAAGLLPGVLARHDELAREGRSGTGFSL